jgi:hypothetical protein
VSAGEPADAQEVTPEKLAWMKALVREWEEQGLEVGPISELLFRMDMAARIGWPDEPDLDHNERQFRMEAVRHAIGPRWSSVRNQAVQVAADYGWGTAFVDEPDGGVRAHLIDETRGKVMKTYLGEDFHDAWLGLGMDTYPPSPEGRN